MKTIIREFIAPAILMIICIVADLLWGYPLFGLAVGVSVVMYLCILSVKQLRGRKEAEWRKSVISYKNMLAVSFAALTFAVFYINRAHVRSSKSEVLSAICRYWQDQGRFPNDIQELVPRFLTRVPRPKLIWVIPNEYRIVSGKGGPNLLLMAEGHPEPDSVALDDTVCK